VNAATPSARAVTLARGACSKPYVLAALLGAHGLLTLTACPAPPSGDATSKKSEAKDAEAGKADTKGEKQTAIDTAEPSAAKDTKAVERKGAGAGAGAKADPVVDTSPKKYRRGMVPPPGMSVEELEKFAADVGDPTGGKLTLAQAFEGDPTLADASNGKLTATFDTTMGGFDCELYEDQAPLTVANFVGLARGTRPTYDKKTDAWVAKKYFDGNIFHRVIKGFMIQTGDDGNTGRGNPGYVIADEFVKGLRHDAAGTLSMANRSQPNTGSTQFFITVRDTKHLDGKHAVFGKCADAKVPIEISTVKVDHRAGDRPYEQVKVNSVTISRKKK
jgi:peptidyl-prolyl cis-trans isomerase A (cyclophilin A)